MSGERAESRAQSRAQLQAHIDVFEAAIGDFVALVREIPDEQWDSPSELAGWRVRDLVAHTAHLEAVLAGAPEEVVAVPDGLAHVTNLLGYYTEQGVIARRDRSRDELLDEIEIASARRLAQLRADPPTDPSGQPPKTPGDIGWNWGTLLSNRPFDVAMHEQDIRRVIGRPGNLDGPGVDHAVAVLGRGLPFVWGKRVQPSPGQRAAVELTDRPTRFAMTADPDGRGRAIEPDAEADTVLRMATETFLVLGGGRRDPSGESVELVGNTSLAVALRDALAVTP